MSVGLGMYCTCFVVAAVAVAVDDVGADIVVDGRC